MNSLWTWATVAVISILFGLGVYWALDATLERDDLVDALEDAVATEAARTDEIGDLKDRLNTSDETIGHLETQIQVLFEQVAALGGTPVVVVEDHDHSTTTTTTQPEPERGPPGPRGPRGPPGEPDDDQVCPLPFLCLGPLGRWV